MIHLGGAVRPADSDWSCRPNSTHEPTNPGTQPTVEPTTASWSGLRCAALPFLSSLDRMVMTDMPTAERIGKFAFAVASSPHADSRWERRAEALSKWLISEWDKNQREKLLEADCVMSTGIHRICNRSTDTYQPVIAHGGVQHSPCERQGE